MQVFQECALGLGGAISIHHLPRGTTSQLTLALCTPLCISNLRFAAALLSQIVTEPSVGIVLIALVVLINTALPLPLPLPRALGLGIHLSIITIVALIEILIRIWHISVLDAIASWRIVLMPTTVAGIMDVVTMMLPSSWICRSLACMVSHARLILRRCLLPVHLAIRIVCHNRLGSNE